MLVRLSLLAFASTLPVGTVRAATFCVQTSQELQAALSAAETNAEADEIRVHTGQYSAPAGGWTTDLKDAVHGLSVLGGFTSATCDQATRSLDASLTVLDGGDSTRILAIETSQSFGSPTATSTIAVSGFTFRNGRDAQISALKVSDPGPIYGGNILIENNIFRDNEVTDGMPFERGGPALLAATDGPDFAGGTGLIVRNNLFAGNVGPNAPAAFLFSNNRIALSNNTFTLNQPNDPNALQQFVVQFFTLTGLAISNNIFWANNPANAAGRFDIQLADDADLLDNDIQTSVGTAATDVGTTSVDPMLANPASGDFSLQLGSPMIDAGADAPQGGLATKDLKGVDRLAGLHVDRGAYEFAVDASEAVFKNGFENQPKASAICVLLKPAGPMNMISRGDR